ncbi:MAG TPA: HAD hydrolase-like protein [Vicinamibacterales bacterium]|nr:HAD hydrolase-like protein [Vicinamibacterales bacterium]
MIAIFWDIDGTLLSTGRAGIFAWEDAGLEVTGHALDFQSLKTDGLTDHQVALKIFEQAGVQPTDESLRRMVAFYESRLPDRLHLRKGSVLTGVREILEHLRAKRPDVHSMLLTGNTAAGARAKLTHYQLQEFFEDGAFSLDQGPRAGIASRAFAAIRELFPDQQIDADQVFVVGDTPHDIECARAIGARTIAVASGVYKVPDLQLHGAWRVLESLPTPPQFEALIDTPADVRV